jgi:hypothetical protein
VAQLVRARLDRISPRYASREPLADEAFLASNEGHVKDDGHDELLHPNERGHRLIAERLFHEVRRQRAESQR